MAGTSASFTHPPSVGGLPVPKVRLKPNSSEAPETVSIRTVGFGGVGDVSAITLFRAPDVVAMDVSDAQIEAGLFVEMLHYTRAKNRNARSTANPDSNRAAGYKVPSPFIGGVNHLEVYGDTTRGGGPVGSGDRPNHYQVTYKNQVVPVWEYFHNRLVLGPVQYNDAVLGAGQFIDAPFQLTNYRSSGYYATSRFPYDGRFTPYRVMFRYIVWDDTAKRFISGPTSPVVEISSKHFPFEYDAVASAQQNNQVANINPLFNAKEMKAHLVTRVP